MAEAPTSFAAVWDRHARDRGERPAVSDRRRSLSWREASDLSRLVARGLLASGAERGSVIASWLPNRVESYVLRVACERAGLTWLPIAARLREWELRQILERVEPSVLVVPDTFHGWDYPAAARSLISELRKPPRLVLAGDGATPLDELVRLAAASTLSELPTGDALVILPTTGSTGIPKFAEFRVSAWLLRAAAQADLLRLREDDVIVALSQGIGPSIIPLFAAPLAGAAVWLIDEFQPDLVIDMLARVRPTIVCGVPAQIITLLDHPSWSGAGLERVRIWYTTGAAFPSAAAERLERSTSGVVLCGYGGMDFGGWTVPSPDDPTEVRLHTVGKPRAGTQIRVIDDAGNDVPPGEAGEIWGRGPCCAIGYYRDGAASREVWTADGWFRTGDLGRRDAAGNLIIVGRKKDRIRRGGMSIEPAEIEALLGSHPKIQKAAVVGFPDPLLGERACAFVVPRNGQAVTLDELRGYLRAQRIASFKIPERLEVVAELPLRGDKIDRAALRRAIENGS
jgi:non-ribosomal peptide synthetase component E (peptide arylation enzyme)